MNRFFSLTFLFIAIFIFFGAVHADELPVAPAPLNCGTMDLKKVIDGSQDAVKDCIDKEFAACRPASVLWDMDGILEAQPGTHVIKKFLIQGMKDDACQVELSYAKNPAAPVLEQLSKICDWDPKHGFPGDANDSKICHGPLMDAEHKRLSTVSEVLENPKARDTLADTLKGKIVIIEQEGAPPIPTYFNPDSLKRYTLLDAVSSQALKAYAKSDTAIPLTTLGVAYVKTFAVMMPFGELEKIPLADFNFSGGKDSDKDGLSDSIEKSLHTNPKAKSTNGNGYDDRTNSIHGYSPIKKGHIKVIDAKFAEIKKGRFFVQNDTGTLWFINPDDQKRYYVGDDKGLSLLLKKIALHHTVGVSDEIDDALHAWVLREKKSKTADAKNPSWLTPILEPR